MSRKLFLVKTRLAAITSDNKDIGIKGTNLYLSDGLIVKIIKYHKRRQALAQKRNLLEVATRLFRIIIILKRHLAWKNNLFNVNFISHLIRLKKEADSLFPVYKKEGKYFIASLHKLSQVKLRYFNTLIMSKKFLNIFH